MNWIPIKLLGYQFERPRAQYVFFPCSTVITAYFLIFSSFFLFELFIINLPLFFIDFSVLKFFHSLLKDLNGGRKENKYPQHRQPFTLFVVFLFLVWLPSISNGIHFYGNRISKLYFLVCCVFLFSRHLSHIYSMACVNFAARKSKSPLYFILPLCFV